MTRLPLPEPDGWAGKDWYHRPATTLADISKFELAQARYTTEQMYAYAAAGYRAGLEAAALVVEASPSYDWHRFACESAAAIRALEISHD